jgi:hypothetical protein
MSKLNEKDTKCLYEKCLKLVKRKPPEFFVFKKMKCQGTCDGVVLEFDYRKELVRTAFHECVHYLHPEWSETMVLYAESRLVNLCTAFEVATFLKYFILKLYKSEYNRILVIEKDSKPRK